MAHDARSKGSPRAGAKRVDSEEPETLSGGIVDETEVHEDFDDLSSIDELLAVTDRGWDLEDQVRTLKQAAATRPLSNPSVSASTLSAVPSRSVALPTPIELRPPRSSASPPPLPARRSLAPSIAPSAAGRTPEPSPARVPADMARADVLVELLRARVTALGPGEDRVSLARAHLELAIACEAILGDEELATAHAEAALAVQPSSAAAHALLRRRRHARHALPAMLEHLDQELAAASSDAHRVELLAEKARLLVAADDRGAEARAAWEQALAHAPHHAAALKGLEAELTARAHASGAAADWNALATHLGRMADGYASEQPLAAWLHVERAQILASRLARADAARGALERALEIEPRVGPVRDALVRHLAARADWGALAQRLDEEALLETSAARAARLELDAASIAAVRLGEPGRACELLERAAARAPTVASVDRRVLDELVRLHEREARWAEAARARRARLRFVTDPAATAWELRALAAIAERSGDLESAITDVQRALSVDGTDATLVETLDRLLEASGRHDARIATWLTEGARTADGPRRARALARAARISEAVGRPADAVRHLRAAWTAAPGEPELLDALARLLSPVLTESVDGGARALVELYAQAAEHATDADRRIAYLERVALLWEELLADAARAARTYEQILAIAPDRRGALLGLERTAARLGEGRTLARALGDEARVSSDAGTRLSLRARAAQALAATDPARAMVLVREVLAEDPAHVAARDLEARLDEAAGRWEAAARSIRARIDATPATQDRVPLWLALAQMQHQRLGRPLDAMASLEQARALDPTHPVPPEEIARILEDHGDARVLRDAIERLATRASDAEERTRHLTRAAEIDELRLGDDASAARTYQLALAEAPDDELVAERLSRVLARRGLAGGSAGLGELAALVARRVERAPSPSTAQALSFELAALLVELDREPLRAAALLESLLADVGDHVPALRTLEALRRRAGEPAPLARVLQREGGELRDVRARLGALWNLAALEEWRLPASDPAATYALILDLDPTDPGALEATLRREMPAARRGEPRARRAVTSALRALVPFASDDESRLALQLRLAFLLEASFAEASDRGTGAELAREALSRYRDALSIDELSVSAATGVARLANELQDPEGAFAAARSLAELAMDARVRARYLVDAAELLLGPDDHERLGPRAERRPRAAAMLERALDADPDSIPAAGRLATVLLEDRQGERLVSVFRTALAAARSADAIVMLGSELARVARDVVQDLTVAIDAMRKVRAAAPQHVPSLLLLAELCIAQRSWPEAVDALESVVSTGREAPSRLTALFALASIYEKVLARPDEVGRVLRAALALEPDNPRALRALLRRIAAEPPPDEEPAARERRLEVADMLTRLARVEPDAEQKTGILLELADVRLRLGDSKAAERALVEAVATSPSNARAFARLGGLYRRPKGRDDAGHARALAAVIALGKELRTVDARWFAALGQLEIDALSRPRDGIAHLQRAVTLDPTLHETRFELASAFARIGAHDEAARGLLGMLSPSAQPLLSISDPAAGLSLLEASLSAARHPDEALVVAELRAFAGELDPGRHAWLRARRPGPVDPAQGVLDRPTLVTHVLPPEGRHILLEIAAAIAGIEAKLLRADLSEVGLATRDRLTARDRHPLRTLLDRVVRQVGLGEVEIAIAPAVSRTRVLAQDVPWLVVPPSLVDQDEMAQLVTLTRAAARIACGVPWLEEMKPAHVEALLVAAARQVVPGYGRDDVDVITSKLVAQYEPGVARGLSRRQRKLLEELAPHIAAPQSRVPPVETFVSALARAELRAAFVVGGDLLAVIDEVRAQDPALRKATVTPSPAALGAALEHTYAGDVARYALTGEATALRRRLGSIWT